MTEAPDMPTTWNDLAPRAPWLRRRESAGRQLAGIETSRNAVGDVVDGPHVVIEFPLAASDLRGIDIPAPRSPGAASLEAQVSHEGGAAHSRRPSTPRVSVVIPTYNEAKNLPEIMGRIPAAYEVVVVDGRSVDDTVEVARTLRPEATIVMQNRRGKGNAMTCGFAAVTGDIVVMLDADGSAAPEEITRFVDALLAGADFAKGTRFVRGGGSSDITPVRAWGNAWLNRIANVLFSTRYTDLCYGYNAFWRDCLENLELDPRHGTEGGMLWGDGFEIETIINTRMAKAGMRITEVPSFEAARVHGESNLNTWRDGVRVLRALVIERLNGVSRRRQPAAARPVAFAGDAAAPAAWELRTAKVRSA